MEHEEFDQTRVQLGVRIRKGTKDLLDRYCEETGVKAWVAVDRAVYRDVKERLEGLEEMQRVANGKKRSE